MALVRKPEQRTEGYDKAKEQDLFRKIIYDEIEGRTGKPFVVKNVRAVEKASCPGQENQAETN